jgi:hypothetical protein
MTKVCAKPSLKTAHLPIERQTMTQSTTVTVLRDKLKRAIDWSNEFGNRNVGTSILCKLLEEFDAAIQPAGDAPYMPDQMTAAMRDAANVIVLDRSKLVQIYKALRSAAPVCTPVQAAPDAERWGRNMLMGVDITAPAVQAAPVGAMTAEKWAEDNVSPDSWDVAIEAFNAGRIATEVKQDASALPPLPKLPEPDRTREDEVHGFFHYWCESSVEEYATAYGQACIAADRAARQPSDTAPCRFPLCKSEVEQGVIAKQVHAEIFGKSPTNASIRNDNKFVALLDWVLHAYKYGKGEDRSRLDAGLTELFDYIDARSPVAAPTEAPDSARDAALSYCAVCDMDVSGNCGSPTCGIILKSRAAPESAEPSAGALHDALMRCCEELPDGYALTISAERGFGCITWINPKREEFDIEGEGHLSDDVTEAFEACNAHFLATSSAAKGAA